MRAKAAKLAVTVLLAALLTGCYLPIKFDAEIEITRSGYYTVIFDGYLVSVPLYAGLRDGSITPLDENEKVANTLKDFKRDSAVQEVKYFKQGRFKVNWRRKGDLLRARMVTFLRRNELMITIKYVKETVLITIKGQSHRQIDRPTSARQWSQHAGSIAGQDRPPRGQPQRHPGGPENVAPLPLGHKVHPRFIPQNQPGISLGVGSPTARNSWLFPRA